MVGVGFLDEVDIGITTDIVCLFLAFSDDGWVEISPVGGFDGTNNADGFAAFFVGDILGVDDAAFFLAINLDGSGEVDLGAGFSFFDRGGVKSFGGGLILSAPNGVGVDLRGASGFSSTDAPSRAGSLATGY
ncbi:hypothetical protein PGT21_021957 [Puccinia graminis f. sp. tritici]|uniref:Uncharacterized protein n=1 Tax=Puccinia graminis f. sp. tritici TaxID=56615 RepID=A0A5B0LZ38_PUCGR|nr:hypothetical protein PGT21_021957 [Puccinia graminis f. sp. tritici]